jgi:hypothetical protein
VIHQDPSDDPARLSDEVRRVMERPEFQYEKSWFDRLSEWIGEQLERLFGAGDTTATASGASFGGGIGSVLAWLLILAAVAAVVAVVVYVVRHRVRRPSDDDSPATEVEIEHRRSAKEWSSDAERLEAEGDWKGAVRARYRHLVRTLVDRRQLPDIAGRTTGELRDDLARTTPAAEVAFDTACSVFELAWYAHRPTGPEQAQELRDAARAVLAAPVERRGDGPEGPDGPSAQPAGTGEVIEVRA